ncbi:conserved membrane hypothetical protein [Candidatus Magnetomoraceae bacterium gMMP-15]
MTDQKIYKEDKMSPLEIESWMKYTWEMKQKAPDRIEDAAKFLAVMISISLSLFLSIFGKSMDFMKSSWIIKSIPAILILALLFSFLVFYPKKYPFSSVSVDSIKQMVEKITRRKKIIFIIAVLFFILAFILFTGCLFF